jgi:hypothetical protein
MVRGKRAEALVNCSDITFRLDKKTANFKVASSSRHMQWSLLTEEHHKIELVHTEFRFMKTTITINAEAITRNLSPPHQHCTAAKYGKLQCGRVEQINAAGYFHWRPN